MILRALADRLKLRREHTTASWSILKQFGNMSSATLIFVLEEIAHQFKRAAKKKNSGAAGATVAEDGEQEIPADCTPFVPMLAFGPGLNVEGCLLKYVGK